MKFPDVVSRAKTYLNLVNRIGYDALTESDISNLRSIVSVENTFSKDVKLFFKKLIHFIEIKDTAPEHYVKNFEDNLDILKARIEEELLDM